MAQSSVIQIINQLSKERERLVAREASHHDSPQDHARLEHIDHHLSVLWHLRRRELAGEEISLNEDYYDHYDRYTDEDAPGR